MLRRDSQYATEGAMKVWTDRSLLYTPSSAPTKPSARIPSSLPPIFTYSDAMAAGLSAERLYRYRDERYPEQLARGLY